MEPDDPGRSPVSRERRQASAGGAVDQLDGVVAVRRREGPAVGGERGGDGGPGRRSKLAVGGGAVAERVGLRPRREGAIERRRRVRVVLWGDARAERRVRASPRGAGVAAARGSAQSAGGIELARADLGKHRSPRPPRSVRSAPRAFPSRPRLKKEPRGESFPPLRRGASPCEAPVPRALPRASGPRRGATVVTGCAIRVSTTPPRARVCPARRRSTRPFDARFVHLAGFYRLDFFQQGQPLPSTGTANLVSGGGQTLFFTRAKNFPSLSHVSYRAKLGFQRGHRPRRLLLEVVPLALAPARLRLDLVRLQPQPLLLRGVAAVHAFEGGDRLPVPLRRGDPGLATLPR